MNRYPLWKYLLVAVVLLLGILYALPNLYGEDPAVQISGTRGAEVDAALVARVQDTLGQENIPYQSVTLAEDHVLVRFDGLDAQLTASDVLTGALGDQYVVALNLVPATPGWLRALGGEPMYLGLDLRGGVHFLMQVDMEAARQQAVTRYQEDLRVLLREQGIRYSAMREMDGGLQIRFASTDALNQARQVIASNVQGLVLRQPADAEPVLTARPSEAELEETRRFALEQNLTTLRNRVNELGVAEPIIQRQGNDRIVVQLPGVQDSARAKEILGATATLEFRMVDERYSPAQTGGQVPVGTKLYHDREGSPILLENRVLLTGDYITDASSGFDQNSGSPAVFINLDGKGARIFGRETAERVGRLMAVVFIETKAEPSGEASAGEQTMVRRQIEEVINVARIQERLGKRFQITGLDSPQEARNLALLLRAGALAAPLYIVEERTVGPSLGRQNIDQGFMSVMVGFGLVLVFMAIYYRVFGLIANLALTFNLILMVALLSLLQATLTLPGIAGIVLTVGMAVDANVLIFERIREEIRNGNTPQASIKAGYAQALSTILDANITTLIAAVVLFGFGTGPIKGFAVTLSIGILTSMFTAILGTRALVNLIYGGRRLKRLPI